MSQKFAVELKQFPTLFRAWALMLLDNTGSVSVVNSMRDKMEKTVLMFPHPPQPAEEELSKLTSEQLDELCTGDVEDRPPISEETEAIITYLFECL